MACADDVKPTLADSVLPSTESIDCGDVVDSISLVPEWEVGLQEDSIAFDQVRSLDVDSQGNVFIADSKNQRIDLFDANGVFKRSLGKSGTEVGFFGMVTTVAANEGDSLFVYTLQDRRIHVYEPDYYDEPVYTVDVQELDNLGNTMGVPMGAIPLKRGRLLVQFDEPNTLSMDEKKYTAFAYVDQQGQVIGEPIIEGSRRQSLFAEFEGGGSIFTPVPFGRKPVLEVNSENELVYGWTDSLSLGIYNLEGRQKERYQTSISHVPLERDTLESLLASARRASPFESEEITQHTSFPDRWPEFKELTIDSSDNKWVKINTEHHQKQTEWRIFDVENRCSVYRATLAGDVSLKAFRDGHAYGVKRGATSKPTVVKYKVHPNE